MAAISVIPRLDEFDTTTANMWMENACRLYNVQFWDFSKHFPYHQTKLWKRGDKIHLSVNFGLPLLLTLIVKLAVPQYKYGMIPIGKAVLPWVQRAMKTVKGGRK